MLARRWWSALSSRVRWFLLRRIGWQKKSALRKRLRLSPIEHLEGRIFLTVSPVEQESVDASLSYLRTVMDQYHNRFVVYEDVSSAGSHFFEPAFFPEHDGSVSFRGNYTDNVHSGATAIRAEFLNTNGTNFGGIVLQNGILPDGAMSPEPNFGTVPNAGFDLTGATRLTFWARGEKGGEKIDFFVGGVGYDPQTRQPIAPYPDSSPAVEVFESLSTTWTQYTIDLTNVNLSYVLGGFGWGASAVNNSDGAVFYLDDIQFELSPEAQETRLRQPRFLQSYTTLPVQHVPFDEHGDNFDFVLRNSAFTYDNALALLAFLADGSPDSVRRAALIGDAFVYASNHDRYFDDGRMRTDYSAGDISLPPGWTPNNRVGTVPVAGYFVDEQHTFYEVERSIDTGNNAWAMIALLALHRRTGQESYLQTARRIGEFIQTQKNTSPTDLYLGFLGGINNPETAPPEQRVYASVEHNLDIYAAFMEMYAITNEPVWRDDALFAKQFVSQMWSGEKNAYLAGTTDPNHRNTNPDQLPLDVQSWSILSLLKVRPGIEDSIEANFRNVEDGISGFDFNTDKDGVWPEGTGQMAVAYGLADPTQVPFLQQELRLVQTMAPANAFGATLAALHDGLTTGFDFKYYKRPHIGATAWNVFAQLLVDPYYLDVLAVNHAPVGTSKTVSTLEDQAYVVQVSDFGFSDPDDIPAKAFKAVQFTTLGVDGTLTNAGVEVLDGQFVSVTDINAGKLVFTPNANRNSATPLVLGRFRVQDDGGILNDGVDLDLTERILSITVTSVNDAPSGAANTVTIQKKKALRLSVADFGFTDIQDTPANTLLSVTIATIPAAGILKNGNKPVGPGTIISATDIAAGKLKYKPAKHASDLTTTLTFQVQDNGGTTNGGIDKDPTPKTLTIVMNRRSKRC